MVPSTVRAGQEAWRWGAVLAAYVGDSTEQISVLQFTKSIRKIQENHGLRPTATRARVYKRLKQAQPPGDLDKVTIIAAQPDAAWEEAEALRLAAPTVAGWTSGLLALLASGHYAEATGVIGLSTPNLSCDRLLRMLNCFADTLYISPFDPEIRPTIVPSPSQLKVFIDVGKVEPVDTDCSPLVDDDAIIRFTQQEVKRLEQRHAARELWTFSDEMHAAFRLGHIEWQRKHRSPKVLEGLLKYAALVVRDSAFEPEERKNLWRDNMMRWIFSHTPGSDPTELGIVQLYDLMANPQSALAKELRKVLEFGFHSKDPIAKLARHALWGLEGVQINGRLASPDKS